MAKKKLEKSAEEWQQLLTPSQYRVTREKGTEPAFTGEHNNNKRPGTYYCVCCGTALFDSDHKYDSGTGWPSFFQPLKDDAIEEHPDHALGMIRTEVVCSKCNAHLGHVFEDGPKPTGLRYCINSVALDFKSKQGAEQASRK